MKKMNLTDAENLLSRDEMKEIMAGSGGYNPLWCGCATYYCHCHDEGPDMGWFVPYICSAQQLSSLMQSRCGSAWGQCHC